MMSASFNVSPEKEKFNLLGLLLRFVPASALLTGFGAFATYVPVSAYLHAIGLPNLIGTTLAASSGLLPLIFASNILLFFYLVMLLITAATYACAVNLFKKTPDVQPLMAYYLLVPTLAGVVATVCTTLLKRNSDVSGLFIDSAICVAVGMITLLLIPRFVDLLGNAISQGRANPPTKLQYLVHMLALGVAAWFAAITATFPMLAILSAGAWHTHSGGMSTMVMFSIIITILGFGPAIAYYVTKGCGLIRVRNALIGVLALIVGTLAIIPSAVPTVVDQAASLAGVKDVRVFSYIVKDTYGVEDFDAGWGKVVTTRGYAVVEGFVLFALGDVTVLCPKSLEGSTLSEWPSVAGACLTMSSGMIKRMPLKSQ